MFKNEILRSCEKIKLIRKRYKLTQQDLAGADISRQLISLIENGQSELTEDTAQAIEKNLRIVLKSKDINNTEISAALLLETEEKQIRNIVDKYNEDLTYAIKINNFNSYIKIHDEVKEIFDKYIDKNNNAKFIDIIKILCQSTLYIGKYDEAKIYVLIGIDKSNQFGAYNDLFIFYNWITVIDIGLREYGGIIPIYNHALNIYKKHNLKNNEILTKLTINAALACRKLNKNIECVEYLTRVKYLSNDPRNIFKIYNLMGKSLLVLKKYDEAESVLLYALEYAKSKSLEHNIDELTTVLENLSTLYLETNRSNKAAEYIDRIEQVVDNIEDEHLKAVNLYYLVAIEIAKNKDNKGKVKSLSNKVINLSVKTKDKLLLYKTSYNTCHYLICIDDVSGLEQLADNIYNLCIENEVIHERIPNVLYTIIEYFEDFKKNELTESECKKIEVIRLKISQYAYKLERQICHRESFDI